MLYKSIEPVELQERLQQPSRLRVIDVREVFEYEIARIGGAELNPLSRFQEWAGELQPETEIVFMCHHGIRSAQVCGVLARLGFTNLYNLSGGIDAWSREVDKNVPLY